MATPPAAQSGSQSATIGPFAGTAGTATATTTTPNPTLGDTTNGAAATTASFNQPYGGIFDRDGNMYVADYNNHKIRRIAPNGGAVTTIAGTGVATVAGTNTA